MTDKNTIIWSPLQYVSLKTKLTLHLTSIYSDREFKFIMTPIEEQKLELDACTEVASISAMVITKGRKIKVRKNRAKCLEMK